MVKVLITGDFCPVNRIQRLIERADYSKIFNDFLILTKEADIILTNLECPLTESEKKEKKSGPNLKAKSKSIDALSFAGFNLVTLANNHIMDYGKEGLFDTINSCKKAHIDFVGAGSDLFSARLPFYKEVKGVKIAVVNFCENEWSVATMNTAGSNSLNPIANFSEIKNAKINADFVIVIVHGGHEYYPLPSPRMQETYRFFIDAGADVVIGHHTHCYSGYETYKDKQIFYSLGNFIFDWPGKFNSLWNKGYAVLLTFKEGRIDFELLPFIQGDENPGIRFLNKKENALFNEEISIMNHQIGNKSFLETRFKEFVQSRKKEYLSHIEPYSNKHLLALHNRGLLPSFVSSKKKRMLLNLIRCEAHRDVLLDSLKD